MAWVLSAGGSGVLGGAGAIRRINGVHSCDEPSQHFGGLHVTVQQIRGQHLRLARQAPGHNTWPTAGCNVRGARQTKCQSGGD
mmetsp:Transcript_67398/g.186587  ORF Transcript_67398/g.186587 Transcript_67398/m.186587 type:complete len:83 (-) Transcript_67398:852-1100(-)